MKHAGNLLITAKNIIDYSAVTQVTGWLDVRKGATLTAPALTTTGGLVVREGATLTAPLLKH